MFHEDKQGNIVLSPKASFALGLFGGVLVLCTIGFFILLGIMLKGDGLKAGKAGKPSPVAVADTVPSDPAAADEPEVTMPPEITDEDHVRGNTEDYEVTLVEYSDYECPYCQNFHGTMLALMDDPDYGGKIRWVYRHFPLSFHPNAVSAANAAECAAEQGEFWGYSDELFASSSLGSTRYEQIAKSMGLNTAKFTACLEGQTYGTKISADQAGGSSAGVQGTPGTIIITRDGQLEMIPGALPLESVKGMLDALL
jgi:protein-disulfide isomerase